MHKEWELKLAPLYLSILLDVEFNILKWQKTHRFQIDYKA